MSDFDVSPDEDTFVVPAVWRRTIHPHRGGGPGTATTPKVDPAAQAQDLVDRLRRPALGILTNARSDDRFAGLGRAHLVGKDPSPEATAVAAAALTGSMAFGNEETADVLVDVWVRDHGVVHAALVVAELAGIFVGNDTNYMTLADDATYLRPVAPDEDPTVWHSRWLPLAYRMRAVLAAAPDAEYARACDAVAAYRTRTARQRTVVAYLFPDQSTWVDEECTRVVSTSGGKLSQLLILSIGTAAQLELVADHVEPWYLYKTGGVVTVVDSVGPAAAPTLAKWFDGAWDAETKKHLLGALSWLPTDEAFQLLVDRLDQKYVPAAVLEAGGRYPVRALRLLGKAADGRSATARVAYELLRGHVLGHPGLVAAAPASLRERVEAIAASAAAVPDASKEDLPRVLVNPPWTTKRSAAKPGVVQGLVPTVEARMAWADGEREAWAASRGDTSSTTDWDAWRVEYGDNPPDSEAARAIARAPDLIARRIIATWRPDETFYVEYWIRCIIARFGLDGLPLALHMVRLSPGSCGPIVLPFAHGEVATLMADWLVRLKSARVTALGWLGRHPECAAAALIPAALGKPGAARKAAEAALRAVAAAGHGDTIRAAADAYGHEARVGIDQLLEIDPLDIVPARVPPVPEWANASLHPRVLLRDRTRALPADSVRNLLIMLALSKPGDVYAGVEVVKQLCDPESLAEFAWSLFARWQMADRPSKEGWVLDALGLIGNDETVRRLTPIIHAWPGEGGHARAANALNIFSTIGSDVALMHLHGIAQKAQSRSLKERAAERIAEVADGLGLTAEQLADRLVPDLGLDPDGSTTLDYGPRRFIVGFDEQLKPYVSDPDGKRRKELPKPGAKDDTAKAEDAYKRFTALKKDVRTIAADQIRRLERAMVAQRRWTDTDFRDLFVAHPVLWHVVRRLVWGTFADGSLVAAMRVAEDRTFADVNDDPVALEAGATVGIAHPLDLGVTLGAWSNLFADYEILQPFPQLGRETHHLTDEERAATRLTRFEGLTVPTGRILSLERRGWVRGQPQDGGVQGWVYRVLPFARAVVIDLEPGIVAGLPTEFPEQTLQSVWLNHRPEGDWQPSDQVRYGDLDPVSVSEILRDLTELKG